MKLYLDDNRPTPPGWMAAHTAEDVQLHLLHGDVDDLSIDRDLDMPHCETCQMQCGHHGHNHPDGQPQKDCAHHCDCHNAGEVNGEHLTEWMARSGHWPKNRPTVHSHNLHGGMRIAALIGQHFPKR